MSTLKYIISFVSVIIITSCVQQSQPKNITVKVDMNGIENPSKVGIRGSNPLSWEETTYLSDNNNDGIYEGVFDIYTANFDIKFKFVHNDTIFELQDQNNRRMTFEYKQEYILYSAVFNNSKDIEIIRN